MSPTVPNTDAALAAIYSADDALNQIRGWLRGTLDDDPEALGQLHHAVAVLTVALTGGVDQ